MAKGSFLRSVITVSSGTVIAQIIGILSQPVISRLYTPEDLGTLVNFTAVTSILAVISTGCYANAVVLPENKKEANAIAYASTIIALVFGLFLTLLCICFKNFFIRILKLENIPILWFYLIGMYVTIIGLDDVLNRYAIRNAHYKVISRTLVTQQIGNNAVKIGFGFLTKGPIGLFIGTVFTQVTRAISLFFGEREGLLSKENKPTFNDIIFSLRRYKKFPLVTSWSVLLNSASVQLPVIIITNLFSLETSGSFSMANQMLNLPMVVVGGSVANVFLQRASEIRSDINSLQKLTDSIYRKLLLFGAVCMSVICFWGDKLFPFVLGSNWETAGIFSQRLSFWLLFVLVASPLGQIYTILEKQGEALVINIILFVSRIATICICHYLNTSSIVMITAYGLVSAILWFIQCLRIFIVLGYPIYKFLLETILIIVPIYSLQLVIFFIIKSFLVC